MTTEEFRNLERGDIVRNKASNNIYIVDTNYGYRVTAIKSVDMTNPSEWILVFKAKHERVSP